MKLELHESKEGGVYVKGLNTFVVRNVDEISGVLEVRLYLVPKLTMSLMRTGRWENQRSAYG